MSLYSVHAAAAPARRCAHRVIAAALQHNRKTDLLRDRCRLLVGMDLLGARKDWNAALAARARAFNLLPICLICSACGPTNVIPYALAGPMQIVRLASRAGRLSRSASETARTVSIPNAWHARIIRTAISPRLAIKTREIVTGESPAHWLVRRSTPFPSVGPGT